MIRFLRNRKKGQIAPFLIAVIVILLIAIMVTVNLGKISLTRTATSNAADAGALAGASTMANGLNSIKDISDGMLADFITTEITLATGCLTGLTCKQAWVIYGAHVASQLAMYGYAWKVAGDTLEGAEEASLRLAFSNSDINEAKPRTDKTGGGCEPEERARGECESYEEWLKRDSRFSKWMEDEGYESGIYTWPGTQKYGQTASAGTNSVTVSSSLPSWGVIPILGFIFGKALSPCPKGMCCICYVYGPTLMGIAKVSGDTDSISLRVTRIEPDINLGLWGMRYRKESEAGITSSAKARAYGGSVLPFGADYDSELIEAN